MMAAAHADTADVVDQLARRFLSVPLPAKDRAAFVEFMRVQSRCTAEPGASANCALVLSTPNTR
jgi:hypothetical protein